MAGTQTGAVLDQPAACPETVRPEVAQLEVAQPEAIIALEQALAARHERRYAELAVRRAIGAARAAGCPWPQIARALREGRAVVPASIAHSADATVRWTFVLAGRREARTSRLSA